ncbi:hypothetical protein LZ32DRAFT_678881 [Colletotrichum eremochloae]|nr:hypothetical protein LZ32DRAFT_678881 [Colletotrichum eremochloae]
MGLSDALEEAFQNLQLDVARFLLQQPETPLHYRCFRRGVGFPPSDLSYMWHVKTDKPYFRNDDALESQSIFTSGSPELLNLLKIFVDFGWHPNQLLGISHGAKLEFGVPLHSLVHRKPNSAAARVMDEGYFVKLWREGPDLHYPFLSNRLAMAQHLITLGEDINRVANIWLLENGADPAANDKARFYSGRLLYPDGASHEEVEKKYEDIIR